MSLVYTLMAQNALYAYQDITQTQELLNVWSAWVGHIPFKVHQVVLHVLVDSILVLDLQVALLALLDCIQMQALPAVILVLLAFTLLLDLQAALLALLVPTLMLNLQAA